MNELKHLAVVMDGNRRWAKAKGFLAKLGYSQG
ncbi:di-trans,poly-cis-decaprenylcistransferase, partial [Campylobacter coli]